jgi:hypothetical protein
MSKKPKEPKNNLPKDDSGATLAAMIREEYNALDGAHAIEISVTELARNVYVRIDAEAVAPVLVEYAALMALKDMAREICRLRSAPQEKLVEFRPGVLFDLQLQPRYPTGRNDDDVYVLRDYLTLRERRWVISRLRSEATTKSAHADALEAETQELIRRGLLRDEAAG